MSRQLCKFDQRMLCVNNYRGEDYGKPNTFVDCEDCIFNPKNAGLKKDKKDPDKVVKTKIQKAEEIFKEIRQIPILRQGERDKNKWYRDFMFYFEQIEQKYREDLKNE